MQWDAGIIKLSGSRPSSSLCRYVHVLGVGPDRGVCSMPVYTWKERIRLHRERSEILQQGIAEIPDDFYVESKHTDFTKPSYFHSRPIRTHMKCL